MTSGNSKDLGRGEVSRRDVRPETDGREETGGIRLFSLVFVDLERAYDTVPR